jgi:hypothetical protein
VRRGLTILVSLGMFPGVTAPGAERLPEVLAVRLTTIDFRPAIRVLVSEDMPASRVIREGREVVVRLPGVAPEELALPEVEKPLQAIRVEREAEATVLRVTVAPEVPFEASFEPGLLTVVFGESPDPERRGPVTPELYGLLFPSKAAESAGGEAPEEAEGELLGEERQGLYLGRVQLLPYLTVSYVNADVLAFAEPVPVRVQYLELTPGVTANSPVFTGRLTAEYEPRLRFFSDIPEIGETAHFAGVRLDVPVGTRTLLRVGHRYTRAVLETTVVDPGREYFFGLARYTFNSTTAAARVDLGPSLALELDAGWRWTRFDQKEGIGFFDHDSRAFRAGLGYDLRSDLRATVSYSYDRIPSPAERPLAESRGHNLQGTLAGQITPLTSGSLTVSVRRQTNPLGVGGSEDFTGITFGGSLRRELSYSSTLGLRFNRSTFPSAFEDNAYYVNNSIAALLDVPLPLGLFAQGSAGFLRNSYPTVSSTLGAARRDDIWSWTVGLGRQLGWRTWLRADYRREERHSNVPGFDVTTDGFLIQFGIGRAGSVGGAR